MALTQVHSGATTVGQVISFQLEETAMLVVSNSNLDSTTSYSALLMILRRNASGSNADYVPMTPKLPLDNDNNYQILTAGSYALKFSTTSSVIVAVNS